MVNILFQEYKKRDGIEQKRLNLLHVHNVHGFQSEELKYDPKSR